MLISINQLQQLAYTSLDRKAVIDIPIEWFEDHGITDLVDNPMLHKPFEDFGDHAEFIEWFHGTVDVTTWPSESIAAASEPGSIHHINWWRRQYDPSFSEYESPYKR